VSYYLGMKSGAEKTETRGVLAGAYRARRDEKATLTHSLVDGAEKSLCGRVSEENLADAFSGDPNALPTCPACLKRLCARAWGKAS
jgi:hypothetical protein